MSRPRVVYSDPAWALRDGRVDAALGVYERAVLDDDVELDLGLYENGRFTIDGPRFAEYLCGADALVIYRAQMTPETVAALEPTCKVVGRMGVGYDNLNAPLLAQAGIYGFNVPDYCVDEVSAHTLALVLALERNIVVQNERIKAGDYSIFHGGRPRRLSLRTFGIVGFGRIGRATARRAQTFYGETIAYDPYVHRDLMAGLGVRKCDTLEELVAHADVIAVNALLTDETRHLIDGASLAGARGALLVNTARGGIVDAAGVRDALADGRLRGYGSDVFDPENPNLDPVNREMLGFPNVIVTAHSAFLSEEAEQSQRTRCAEEVRAVLFEDSPPRFGRLA